MQLRALGYSEITALDYEWYLCHIIIAACVADIAFVIDNSGSIRDNDPPGGNNWNLILDFVKSIIDVFDVGQDATRFAAVDFGTICIYNKLLCRWTYDIESYKFI